MPIRLGNRCALRRARKIAKVAVGCQRDAWRGTDGDEREKARNPPNGIRRKRLRALYLSSRGGTRTRDPGIMRAASSPRGGVCGPLDNAFPDRAGHVRALRDTFSLRYRSAVYTAPLLRPRRIGASLTIGNSGVKMKQN